MKRTIKSSLSVIAALLILIAALCFNVSAAKGSTTIWCSNTNPTVGDNITVTVKFTANEKVNAAEGVLNYTSSKLEYVSGSNNTNLSSVGSVKLVDSGNASNFSFDITFKVIGDGNAELILNGCKIADSAEYEITGSSVRLLILSGNEGTVPSDNPSVSSNADLKSITVSAGTLTPAFSPNVTEYKVTVPNNKTDGIVYCQTADSNSKITINGERNLAVGITKRSITVTASDGTKKVYNITFNRLDENGNDTVTSEIDEENSVKYNGREYFITDDFADMSLPLGFSVGIFEYNGKEISCIKDSANIFTVLCLKDAETAERKFYIYDLQKGFLTFNYIELNGGTYVIKSIESGSAVPNGCFASYISLNGENVECYKFTDQSLADYVILNAVSPNGNSAFYRYDIVENTIQRYPDIVASASVNSESQNELSAGRRNNIIILFVIVAELIVAVITVAVLLIVKKVKAKEQYYDSQNPDQLYDSDNFIIDGSKNAYNGTASESSETDDNEENGISKNSEENEAL